MSADVVMPRLSDSMEEGTILTWVKRVGDQVAVGEEIVEIETDKANMAYESDLAGTLAEILVEEGGTAPVGTVIARIESADAQPSPEPPPSSPRRARIRVSPLARRLADQVGVELSALRGTGPGGRIVKRDVEAAAPKGSSVAIEPAGGAAKGDVAALELTRLQQTVARRMSEAKATVPHFYLEATIEMSRAVEARRRLKAAAAEGELVPSFNDMVVKGCALALREFPKANGSYRDGRIELYSRINVGVAVAANDALVVPTVFDADTKGLRQIASESRALAGRVRDGSITSPELTGGTFTVTNLGMFGIRSFGPVINPPQAAILAVGAIEELPALRGDELVSAPLMRVTLACDHRILYGAEGAKFLARVKGLLEEPLSLAL